MICAGNWPTKSPCSAADAAICSPHATGRDKNREGAATPTAPHPSSAHAAGSIYCEKYDYINVDIRDHVVIFTLHLLQRMTFKPIHALRKNTYTGLEICFKFSFQKVLLQNICSLSY